MAGWYTLHKNEEKFWFNLVAGNGEVILTSQMYKQRDGALNGVRSVQKNSQNDELFERKQAVNGKLFFTIKATNGQVIGKSQMYATESGRDNGIKSVKTNGPTDDIRDKTEAAS